MTGFARTNFGVVRTDKRRYSPLDEARITFECRSEPSAAFASKVCDGAGRASSGRRALACGRQSRIHHNRRRGARTAYHPGVQGGRQRTFLLGLPHGQLVLAPETAVHTEGTDMDEFFRWLRESLEGSLDWALYGGKWVAGDKAGDNSPMNLCYPRFRLDSSVYFEDAETLKGQLNLSSRMAKGHSQWDTPCRYAPEEERSGIPVCVGEH